MCDYDASNILVISSFKLQFAYNNFHFCFHQLSPYETAFLDLGLSVQICFVYCREWKTEGHDQLCSCCLISVSWEKKSVTHTHTRQWTPALSPLTASSFIIRVDRLARRLQRHFPCPGGSSDSGPGGYTLVPVRRLEGGQSHNSTVFGRAFIGCVSLSPHSILLSSVFQRVSFTQQKTHACLCFISRQWKPEARCNPSLTSLTFCYPHLKPAKHLLFTHLTSGTHTHTHSSHCFLKILCNTQVFCWKHWAWFSEKITVRLMNALYCTSLWVSAYRVKNIHVFACSGGA